MSDFLRNLSVIVRTRPAPQFVLLKEVAGALGVMQPLVRVEHEARLVFAAAFPDAAGDFHACAVRMNAVHARAPCLHECQGLGLFRARELQAVERQRLA